MLFMRFKFDVVLFLEFDFFYSVIETKVLRHLDHRCRA